MLTMIRTSQGVGKERGHRKAKDRGREPVRDHPHVGGTTEEAAEVEGVAGEALDNG